MQQNLFSPFFFKNSKPKHLLSKIPPLFPTITVAFVIFMLFTFFNNRAPPSRVTETPPPLVTETRAATPPPFSLGSFKEKFDIIGLEEHFNYTDDGKIWHLWMNRSGGCEIQHKERYRFGYFSLKLKAVGGNSAGIVTAFYMNSDKGSGRYRDELDIELLGNREGQPYILQTNMFVNGTGEKELRHKLWFDPTEDYHTYSILWNFHQIVFFVDDIPIRIYKNNGKPNGFYPYMKPMYVLATIWDAEEWATEGGRVKTDWSLVPFVSSMKEFHVEGCQWEDPYPACVSTTTENWWDQSPAWRLTEKQKKNYEWVQNNYLIYHYCKDKRRHPVNPPEECSLNWWE